MGVITKMGNHLRTLDGNAIGDDERGNAAQWVKKQDDIYGEAMEVMHKEWPNLADEAMWRAKEFARERQKHAKKKYRKLMPGDIKTKKDKKKESQPDDEDEDTKDGLT